VGPVLAESTDAMLADSVRSIGKPIVAGCVRPCWACEPLPLGLRVVLDVERRWLVSCRAAVA